MGARFAKWRAVIHLTDVLPSSSRVNANAYALARYASLCQEHVWKHTDKMEEASPER